MKKISLLLVLVMLTMTLALPMNFVSAETDAADFIVTGASTKIEFEEYSSGYDADGADPSVPEQGSSYVILRKNDYVIYDVDVALSGAYKLKTSIQYPGVLETSPLSVYSNSELVATSKYPEDSGTSWANSKYVEKEADNLLYLGKGRQNLRFTASVDAHFNYFTLERVGDIPETFSITYDSGLYANGYITDKGGEVGLSVKGGSFCLRANDYVNYPINVKKTGLYSFKLMGGNADTKAAGVKVYSGTDLIINNGIAYSEGWVKYKENDFGTIVLTEGATTLKFVSSQAAYYKSFTLERIGDVPEDYQKRYDFEYYSGGKDASVEGSTAPEYGSSTSIILRPNDYALYDIDVLKAGEYKLITAIRYPGNLSGTPVSVYSNGELLTTSKIPNTGTTWANATYVEQEAENTFYLSGGKQTFKFTSSSDAYFDYFIIARIGDIPENFTETYYCGVHAGGYDASEDSVVAAGNSASGSVELQPNDYRLYNINVKSAGVYELKIWAGNNDPKAAGLKIYQHSALLADGAAQYSGGWLTWAENDFGTIVLPEGQTTLKFLSSQVAYYKYFTLQRIGDIPFEKTISFGTSERVSSYDSSAKAEHTTKTYLSFGKDDTVTFKADFPADGTYNVVVKAGVKTNNYSAVRLFIDGQLGVLQGNLINNADWQTAEETTIGSVEILEGIHEIKFVGLADEFWFFGADFTTEVPNGEIAAQADYLVQAENFKNAIDNTEGLDDSADNLVQYSPVEVVKDGERKVVCFEAGETLEYGLIGLANKGYYNVKFEMAGLDAEYTVKVGAKGGKLTEAIITPSADGNYSIVTVADVLLKKGNSDFVIEVSGEEGQMFKLDKFMLYKDSVSTSFDKASGKATATVKLEGLFKGDKASATLVVYENGAAKKIAYTDYEEIATVNDLSKLSLSLSNMTFEEGKTYSAMLYIWNGAMQGDAIEIEVK